MVFIEQAVHPLATAKAHGSLCEVHRIALTALMPKQHRVTVIKKKNTIKNLKKKERKKNKQELGSEFLSQTQR